MTAIIHTTEQLKQTAKVNSSTDISVFNPFLQVARDVYLVRYLGEDLVCLLEQDVVAERARMLLEKVRKCLGPLALWIGNAELSVRIGDSGFTVEKRDNPQAGPGYVPASDTKIAKVEESLERRAFLALDLVLEYLDTHADDFPEWETSHYRRLQADTFIRSATEFQELGLVDIGYSRLTFDHFHGVMKMVEIRFVEQLLGRALYRRLLGKLGGEEELTPAEDELAVNVRRFAACKTAELHTSERSKANREGAGRQEFHPVVRPVYADTTDTGNWFKEQADFYLAEIQRVLNENAAELGVEPFSPALEWNKEERRLMADIG